MDYSPIQDRVKLIVWDLDETFWEGTLEEGGITPVESNLELVRELSRRGIISSICSKNDHARTRSKLEELEIWDHFVFPAISFAPKGKAVAQMIEAAALRAQNVLFIDDNSINREEVKFFNPGIMTAHPADVLHQLLEHPHLAGKPDPELTRLKQYQFLQRKVEERESSDLSNEDFLRASGLQVTIDQNVMQNFDRIVELINRTNQLNYTKQRLESEEDIAQFRQMIDGFGYHAGCVRAVDRYGDYGLVGFYLLRRRSWLKKLVHFVFSCRTMNMGIEQYVYETLERPEIDVAGPVSYGLDVHQKIDWINTAAGPTTDGTAPQDNKLVLLGGCDLLQLATYCSRDRFEFVNRNEGRFRIRYDDPGFILGDRGLIEKSEILKSIPYWRYEDALRFDEALAVSDIVLVSLWSAMNGYYYKARDGVEVRFNIPDGQKIRNSASRQFDSMFEEVSLDDDEKMERIRKSFGRIGDKAPRGKIFVIGCSTLGAQNNKDKKVRRRTAFNEACRAYCADKPSFFYVDIDAVVPAGSVVGNGHFSRAGYFALAQNVLERAGEREGEAASGMACGRGDHAQRITASA